MSAATSSLPGRTIPTALDGKSSESSGPTPVLGTLKPHLIRASMEAELLDGKVLVQ